MKNKNATKNLYTENNALISPPLHMYILKYIQRLTTLYTAENSRINLKDGITTSFCFQAHNYHCSKVTTSTAWPSRVIVLSIRVATGAIATCTGRFP